MRRCHPVVIVGHPGAAWMKRKAANAAGIMLAFGGMAFVGTALVLVGCALMRTGLPNGTRKRLSKRWQNYAPNTYAS